ncbi:hypothetical protein B296_00030129 [Ensete ventricosum]|uniref:Uncharacterized protein n=1 Tax=Ensete ventricosum TaxID=4639 RepID=A0A427AFS3_ENSVE|nr:hypothetical protein B296_00030129 [Ensete ventricosum]
MITSVNVHRRLMHASASCDRPVLWSPTLPGLLNWLGDFVSDYLVPSDQSLGRLERCSSCIVLWRQTSWEYSAIDRPRLAVPNKEAAPHGEGRSKHRDKATSRPQSIRDLYRVRARSRDEPFLAQEIVNLLEQSREGSLEALWATLTPKSQV